MIRIYLHRIPAGGRLPRRADYEAAKEELLARACSDLGVSPVTRKDIERTKEGKPFLPGNPFYLSFSDSGEVAALGVSDAPIGIDVQRIEEKTAFEKLAKRFYRDEEADEVCSGDDLEERRLLFFRLWTAKEAYLKYLGTGLAHGMDRFVTDLERGLVLEDGKSVPLAFFGCPDGYIGAVCGDGAGSPGPAGAILLPEGPGRA